MSTRYLAVWTMLAVFSLGANAEPPKPPTPAKFATANENPTQISCGVVVLSVREDLLDRLSIDVKKSPSLTATQYKTLMEAVQGDRFSNVTQCPKATLFDGQDTTIRTLQKTTFVTGLDASRVNGNVVVVPKKSDVELGSTLTLRLKASADQKFVNVQVNYSEKYVDGATEVVPVTAVGTTSSEGGSRDKAVTFIHHLQVPKIETITIEKSDQTIPSGGYVVLPGPTRTQDERQDFGPPVLSKVPYVNRLFKNKGVAQTTVRTYLVVSPLVLDPNAVPVSKR